jgi:hypothetical protein
MRSTSRSVERKSRWTPIGTTSSAEPPRARTPMRSTVAMRRGNRARSCSGHSNRSCPAEWCSCSCIAGLFRADRLGAAERAYCWLDRLRAVGGRDRRRRFVAGGVHRLGPCVLAGLCPVSVGELTVRYPPARPGSSVCRSRRQPAERPLVPYGQRPHLVRRSGLVGWRGVSAVEPRPTVAMGLFHNDQIAYSAIRRHGRGMVAVR